MKYNFKQFFSEEHYVGLRVSKTQIYATKRLMKEMLEPESVSIYLDKENSAIALQAGGKTPVRSRKSINQISGAVSKVMPIGRYYFQEKQGDLFICVLQIKKL